MHEAGNNFGESNNDESISENSSCTLNTYSPLSDLMESDSSHDFGQVIDPLRFPIQEGDEISHELGARPKRDGSTNRQNSAISCSRESHNSPKKFQDSSVSSNPTPRHSSSSNSSTPRHSSSSFSPHAASSSRLSLNISAPSVSGAAPSSIVAEHQSKANSSRSRSYSDKSQELNLSELGYSLPGSQVYELETVDFPSSPTSFHSCDLPKQKLGVVRLAEGEREFDKENPPELPNSAISLLQSSSKVNLQKVERPKSLEVTQRKRLTVTEELLNLSVDEDLHSVSTLSDNNTDEDDDAQMHSHDEFTDMLTPDDIETPDELEESIMERLGPEDPPVVPQPESSLKYVRDETTWRDVVLLGIERRIDMKVIEPYKKVLSHGGYMLEGNNDAIIIFSACFLPDRSRRDYDYVMDHLFMYVLTTLDQLIEEDYVLVYLHGATTRGNMPSFAWLKRCYQMIDRRLRKNLQGLYLVHPTFWVKTVVIMARPFVSSKFARKLRFISSLKELSIVISLDQVCIPSRVKQYDDIRESLVQK